MSPGQTRYYLVRAWNSCGGGSFGSMFRDASYPDTDLDGPSDVCDP